MDLEILVVEPDENDVIFIRKASQGCESHCRLHFVSSAEAALGYLRGEEGFGNRQEFPMPDAIILGLDLPEMNGFQLLERLRQNPAWASIPRIVLTNWILDTDADQARKAGASLFIVKPSSFQELRRVLSETIGRIGSALALRADGPA